MKAIRLLALCAGLALLLAVPAHALQIIDGPNSRPLSPNTAEIRWTTDLPSDSHVLYGTNYAYNLTASSPTLTTTHVVTLPGLAANGVYDLDVTSSAGPQQAEEFGFYVVPDQLAVFQLPSDQDVVTGTVRLKARAGTASMTVFAAQFYYIDPITETPVLIGTDNNGDDAVVNTFQPAPTGDGWSAYWNTSPLPEGNYILLARLQTDIGLWDTTIQVYVDPTPPFPSLVSPGFGDVVSGTVPIRVVGGQGLQAQFDIQPVMNALLTFSAVTLFQTNYPFDGTNGSMMCDPTAEASIFLSDPRVRTAFQTHPPCNTNANPAQCAERELVKCLAMAKKTGKTGTKWDNEAAGTAELIKKLKAFGVGFDWDTDDFTASGSTGYGSGSFKEAFKIKDKTKVRKGVLARIYPCDSDTTKSTGHAIVIVNFNDTPTNGLYCVQIMDPARGNITIKMTNNGGFAYPAGAPNCYRVYGGRTWSAPKPPSLFFAAARAAGAAGPDDWQMLGVDADGTDGWNFDWNTANCTPGLYWLRVNLTDAAGHQGEDMVEVFIPPHLTVALSGPQLTLSWPTPTISFGLEGTSDLSDATSWMPLTNTVAQVGVSSSVSLDQPNSPTFFRLVAH